MTITPEMLVQREVFYCVSPLVSTLAQGIDNEGELGTVAWQALDLASPIDDWEEAAIQEGWYRTNPIGATYWRNDAPDRDGYAYLTAQEACEAFGIEPYQREVFEHWIVSDWLADKLAEKGEKVDKDFAGMTIWARTTTGQGIASDSVIEAICAELNV